MIPIAALVVGLAALSSGVRQAPPLIVSAATSLSGVLDDAVTAYTAAGGGAVRLNFGGSNTLARQILNGAPVDVFISADQAQMDVVERGGLVRAGSRVEIARNQLAVLAAPDKAAVVREQFDKAPPQIRRIALGDPSAVPAGVYARQYLERLGLWKAYERRIVPTANVRSALVAVETGGVDAAIVYATDAAIARRAVVAFVVASHEGPAIVYPAAALAGSRQPEEARRFLAFLRGPGAAAIFARHGFLAAGAR